MPVLSMSIAIGKISRVVPRAASPPQLKPIRRCAYGTYPWVEVAAPSMDELAGGKPFIWSQALLSVL